MFHHPLDIELTRRMQQPQRHRLLQGYPMAPLMKPYTTSIHPLEVVARDERRPLIIGVLPHTSCNPSVRGCGFCTFPHEAFENTHVTKVAGAVTREIAQAVQRHPDLTRRDVHGVYLGGGTANLTPPAPLAALLAQIAASFDLSRAELTLEGVPRYFLTRKARCLDLLAETPARHRRISMGVQSFDPAWQRKMGRQHFGDTALIASVVAAAHARKMTTSIDLLYNLPGQTLAQSAADVEQAIAIGADQVCLYNLVLSTDIESQWASDPGMLDIRIPVTEACERWLALRSLLLARGFVQTTLTNFERADQLDSQRFVYERASFDPAVYDAIGFGPAAISTFTAADRQSAVKWSQVGLSSRYLDTVSRGEQTDRMFSYTADDLQLLHITRNLSRLGIDRTNFLRLFNVDLLLQYAEIISLLQQAGLVAHAPDRLELTPTGMFYADTVAGLFSHPRVVRLRAVDNGTDDADSRRGHM